MSSIHDLRIPVINLAFFDVAGTVLLVWLLSLENILDTPFHLTLLFLFVIGEIIHLIFGIDTQFLRWIKQG